jgi:hypothetical protein
MREHIVMRVVSLKADDIVAFPKGKYALLLPILAFLCPTSCGFGETLITPFLAVDKDLHWPRF